MYETNEYEAVRHILSSPLIAARCAPYIRYRDFDWPGLLAEAETLSGGGQVLVRIAYDLWESSGIVGIWELPRRLDATNFARVVEALTLYRSDAPLAA